MSASIVWNRRHDVTGLPVAARANFAQVLACRDDQMEPVLVRIRRDRHHRAMHAQIDEPIARRLFANWSMAYAQRDDLSEALGDLHDSDAGVVPRREMLKDLSTSDPGLLSHL